MVDAFAWFAAATLLLGVRIPVSLDPAPDNAPGILANLIEGWVF